MLEIFEKESIIFENYLIKQAGLVESIFFKSSL